MSAPQRQPLEQRFARATELHRQGQLAAAEQAYREIHTLDRRHAGALAMLGTLALQTGRPAEAVPLLRDALALSPANAAYWNNLGKASKDSGDAAAARAAYQRAVQLQPDQAQFLCNLANLELESQQHEAAIALYRRVLALQPAHALARQLLAMAHNNHGHALCARRDDAGAEQAFRASLALQPEVPEVHANLAGVLRRLERHHEALQRCAAALAGDPALMAAWNNQGLAQLSLQQPAAALLSLERACALQPASREAAANRAGALQALERHEDALRVLDSLLQGAPADSALLAGRAASLLALDRPHEALASVQAARALDAQHVDACSQHVAVLRRLGRADEALAVADQLLAARPQAGTLHGNRGVVLNDLGRCAEALAAFEQASRLQPQVPSHAANRAATRLQLCDPEGARADFQALLAARPDLHDIRLNLGMLDLAQGRWASGWQGYEARLALPGVQQRYPQLTLAPAWDGRAPLAGRTLLVWSEQGLGDTLQFVRLLAQLPAAGARVLLQVPEVLHGVLADLPALLPGAELRLTRPGEPVPPLDWQLSLLSLPHRLALDPTRLPPLARWLHTDAAQCAHWQRRLGDTPRPEQPRGGARPARIGLVWSGNPRHVNDRNRSLPLAELLAALPRGFEYHLVQKDLAAADRALLVAHPELRWHGDALHDFSDTAALLAALDHLVSVDTSVAHLAGGLGLPVSLLLPAYCDFRWLSARDDSPWYPSLRLYRQHTARDWAAPLARVFADLAARFGAVTTAAGCA